MALQQPLGASASFNTLIRSTISIPSSTTLPRIDIPSVDSVAVPLSQQHDCARKWSFKDVWSFLSTSLWGTPQDEKDWHLAPKLRPEDLREGVVSDIPEYVLDYAPLVHLYSKEQYWPSHISEHLEHVTPELDFTPLQASEHVELSNLSSLNRYDYAKNIYLTSKDNPEDKPAWLLSEKNIPVAGRSDAPAVLIVVDKGDGIVDAFWFFFYSFNQGNVVFFRFGNHVGDWEHTLIRFKNGKPKGVFVSEHFFGQAYTYAAVEKIGKRPVVYSATGTHAMYANTGLHAYVLPWSLLHDSTDKGPLWDPAANSMMYTYDLRKDILRPSNFTPEVDTDWFHFAGHWGDKQYPLGDSRQYGFGGGFHYVSGPLGPKFKNLGRRKICQGPESETCVIRQWLGGSRVQVQGNIKDMAERERERFARKQGI